MRDKIKTYCMFLILLLSIKISLRMFTERSCTDLFYVEILIDLQSFVLFYLKYVVFFTFHILAGFPFWSH